MTCAAVVTGNLRVGTTESRGWEELRRGARALQHDDGATQRDQCLNDAGKNRDAQPAGDAYGRPLPFEVETSPEWAEEV
jgi:hypothetical protein